MSGRKGKVRGGVPLGKASPVARSSGKGNLLGASLHFGSF